jgi:hypothetical protein
VNEALGVTNQRLGARLDSVELPGLRFLRRDDLQAPASAHDLDGYSGLCHLIENSIDICPQL